MNPHWLAHTVAERDRRMDTDTETGNLKAGAEACKPHGRFATLATTDQSVEGGRDNLDQQT